MGTFVPSYPRYLSYGARLALAKYEYDTANGVSYSVFQVRIVFIVYRIHIFVTEYEYLLATPCTEKCFELC
jgi:hypothetical protein